MRDAKAKKLIDPIRDSEIDAFMEYCNSQLKLLYSNSNLPQMRIMYNPLTNQELFHESTSSDSHAKSRRSGLHAFADFEDPSALAIYESEALKHSKNIYSLFEGRIHLRADTATPAIEVTCFVETMEAIMKDCPVFKNEDMLIVQTGESEMLETKEFLIKSYQCETILSLFGSIESATEEG